MTDSIYQRGSIMGKRGTILPRSAELGREHSGTVFDVNRPLEQNIVEIDASGRQVVHHLDAAAVAQATQAARAGKTVDPTRFGKRVNEPISPTYHRVAASAPLDSDLGEPTTGLPFVIQDDSKPFEEYPEISASLKSEPIPKSSGKGASPRTPFRCSTSDRSSCFGF